VTAGSVAGQLGITVQVRPRFPDAVRFAGALEVGLRHNPNRAQLLVSRLLGKHIPVPAGEGLATVSSRAAAAIRDVRRRATKDQTVLICSHGDVIKAVLADALGMHLDSFQRIVVAPASLSVIRFTPLRPFVERINDTGDLGSLGPHPPPAQADRPETASDAVPGGVTR